MNITREQNLIAMAAKLLSVAFQTAQLGSDPAERANAVALHDDEKLYPRLVITACHGSLRQTRLELVLCDPHTDETVVRMLEITGDTLERMTCQ